MTCNLPFLMAFLTNEWAKEVPIRGISKLYIWIGTYHSFWSCIEYLQVKNTMSSHLSALCMYGVFCPVATLNPVKKLDGKMNTGKCLSLSSSIGVINRVSLVVLRSLLKIYHCDALTLQYKQFQSWYFWGAIGNLLNINGELF